MSNTEHATRTDVKHQARDKHRCQTLSTLHAPMSNSEHAPKSLPVSLAARAAPAAAALTPCTSAAPPSAASPHASPPAPPATCDVTVKLRLGTHRSEASEKIG